MKMNLEAIELKPANENYDSALSLMEEIAKQLLNNTLYPFVDDFGLKVINKRILCMDANKDRIYRVRGYKINTVGKNTNILNEFRIVNFSRTELFFVNYNTYKVYKDETDKKVYLLIHKVGEPRK